jgi:Cu(I)/Ag(I) efflux system membrane fusion protein
MKKIIIIILAILGGLLLGYLIFGNKTSGAKSEMNNSQSSEIHIHEEETEMWTCSMHPQIMLPEPGDCPICGMDLIPAESNTGGLSANEFKLTENAMALANIETTIVGNDLSDENSLTLSGKIKENEEANSIQASYFGGRIEKLYVNFTGEEVRRGQLLASIYSPELVSAQQELITAASLKESQPKLYNAVRNKLKLWKLSENQINQIESLGTVKESFPIYANVSGTVSEKMAQEGDYVKQGQPLFKIANLNTVWAVFDAYENQISLLKKGQSIKIVTNAYPNKEFDASISFIDPVLNSATRTVMVRANLANTKDVFKPGMFIQGKVMGLTTSTTDAVIIPSTAVLWTGERSLVYVKTDPNEPVFEMREISLGLKNGNNYTILKGLKNGDEIVTNGTFTVDAAAQLRGVKSMMNSVKKEVVEVKMEMMLPKAFQKDFINVVKAYLQLKDAFVESNTDKVAKNAKLMSQKYEDIAISSVSKMAQSHIAKSIEMLKAITGADDIEDQRNYFVILSDNTVALASNLDVVSNPLYVQKCPMANSNKGAVWISDAAEIRNPYYGDAMLTCGSVIDTLKIK